MDEGVLESDRPSQIFDIERQQFIPEDQWREWFIVFDTPSGIGQAEKIGYLHTARLRHKLSGEEKVAQMFYKG